MVGIFGCLGLVCYGGNVEGSNILLRGKAEFPSSASAAMLQFSLNQNEHVLHTVPEGRVDSSSSSSSSSSQELRLRGCGFVEPRELQVSLKTGVTHSAQQGSPLVAYTLVMGPKACGRKQGIQCHYRERG